MALYNLTASPEFPETTAVSAFPVAFWAGLPPARGDTPRGTTVSSGVVDSHGYALIEGLANDTPYYFGAQVGGVWRWKSGRTASTGEGTGGGSGPSEGAIAALIATAVGAEAVTARSAEAGLAATIAAIPASSGLTAEQVENIVVSFDPVTSKKWPMGTVSGAVTPDLSKGRVFEMTSSGVVKLKPPTNAPGSANDATIPVLIVVKGANDIELVGIAWEGEPLVFDTSEASSENVIPLESRDGGATWKAIGGDALPTDVLHVNGSPSDKNGVFYDLATKTWKPAAPFTTAQATAAAEAVVATSAIVNASAGAVKVTGTLAAGSVAYGTSGSAMAFTDLATLTAAKLTLQELTSSATLAVEHFYRYNGTGGQLTMPTPAGTIAEGARIVIENVSAGVLKVKGRFTFGSETETVRVMHAGEILTYVCTAEGKYWRATSGLNTPVTERIAALGGYLAATGDQMLTVAGTPTTKTIHIGKVMVPSSIGIGQISVQVVKAGTLTYAAAAIILSTGVIASYTADEHVAWETTGVKAMSTGGGAVSEIVGGTGAYAYIAILCVGTVMPELAMMAQPASPVAAMRDLNANVANAAVRSGEARNTAGETAVYTTLEPPTAVDLTKSRGRSNDFPLFWAALG